MSTSSLNWNAPDFHPRGSVTPKTTENATGKTDWKFSDSTPTFKPGAHFSHDATKPAVAAPAVPTTQTPTSPSISANKQAPSVVQPVLPEPARAAPAQTAPVNSLVGNVLRTVSCPPATETVPPKQPPPKKEVPASPASPAPVAVVPQRPAAKTEEKHAKREAAKGSEKSPKTSTSPAPAETKVSEQRKRRGESPAAQVKTSTTAKTPAPAKTPTPPPQQTSTGKKDAAKPAKQVVTVTVSRPAENKGTKANGHSEQNGKEDMKKSTRPTEEKKAAVPKEETPKKKEEAHNDGAKNQHRNSNPEKKPAASKAAAPKVAEPKAAAPKTAAPKAAEPKAAEPKASEPKPVVVPVKLESVTKKESASTDTETNAKTKTPTPVAEPVPSASPSPPLIAPDATMATVRKPVTADVTPVPEVSDKEGSAKAAPSAVERVTERSATVAAVGVTPPSVTPLVSPSRSVGPLAYMYTVPELMAFRDKSPMLDSETQRKIREAFSWEKAAKRSKGATRLGASKGAQARAHLRGSGMHHSRAPRALPHSENGFKVTLRSQVAKLSDKEQTKRAIQEILNKLVAENADVLTQELLGLDYHEDQELYDALAESVFNKAVQEPLFVNVYAQLCVELNNNLKMPDWEDENHKKLTFKRLLVRRCQNVFDNRSGADPEDKDRDSEKDEKGLSAEELELRNQRRVKSRRQYLGNIVFATELFKRRMLTANVMVRCCVQALARKIEGQDYSFVEPLYKLLKNVGEELELKNAELMTIVNRMYDTLRRAVVSKTIGNRDRFMIEDVLEMQKEWARRALQIQHSSPAPKAVEVAAEVRPKAQKTETTVRNSINTTLDEFVENGDEKAAFSYFDEDVAASAYMYTLLPTVVAYVLDKPPSLRLAEQLSTLVVDYAKQRREPLFGGLRRAMEKLAEILGDLECATDKVIEVFSAFMGNVLAENEFQGTTELLDGMLKLRQSDPFCTSKEKEYGLPALLFFGALTSAAQHARDADEVKRDMAIMWSSVAKSPALLFDSTELFVSFLRRRGLEYLAPMTVDSAEAKMLEDLHRIPELQPALFHRFLADNKTLMKDPDAALQVIRHLLETAVFNHDIVSSATAVSKKLSAWKTDLFSLMGGEQPSLRVQAGLLDILVEKFGHETDKFCNVLSPFLQFKLVRKPEFQLWQESTPLETVNQAAKKECAAKAIGLLRSSK